MYDDVVIRRWELAKLICEQAKLPVKRGNLTLRQKRQSRARGKKIKALLQQIRFETESRIGQWSIAPAERVFIN